MDTSSLSGFACPQEVLDEQILEFVVTEHARATVRLALERHRAFLDRRGTGIVKFLERVESEELHFLASWEAAWGEMFRTLQEPPSADVETAAASLALWLGACGISGDWSIRLPQPERLRWDQCLLPAAHSLDVRSDGDVALIQLISPSGSPSVIRLQRTNRGWSANGELSLIPGLTGPNGKIVLLPAEAISTKTHDYLGLKGCRTAEAITGDTVAQFTEALAFIEAYAPTYLPWIFRVLRNIVLIDVDPRIVTSGSSVEAPGLIHMSLKPNSRYIGEILVHEATHQYIHIVNWLGELDDGTDKNLYYSPLKKTGRPLSFILLAFHAVANIHLYYRECLGNGAVDDGFFAQNEPLVAAQLEQLSQPLRNNPALSDLGQAICQPLLRRLS